MNPLLQYVDKKVAIHTPTYESSKIVHNWIVDLGGRGTSVGNYKEEHCHGMEGVSKRRNNFGSKDCFKDSFGFIIIHFDELVISTNNSIIEVW